MGLELEDLHDRAAGEGMDNRPGRRLDDDGLFLHRPPGEPLDLRAQLITGDGEQGSVVALHLGGAGGAPGEDLLRRGERLMERDDDGLVAGDDRHRLRDMPRSLRLQREGDLGELLGNRRGRSGHGLASCWPGAAGSRFVGRHQPIIRDGVGGKGDRRTEGGDGAAPGMKTGADSPHDRRGVRDNILGVVSQTTPTLVEPRSR